MSIKRLLFVFLVGTLFIGGCIFGDDDGEEKVKELNNINQLTMGGGVFIFREQGFGMAQIGTFNEIIPYEDATVYVNGIQLANNMGIHTNAEQFSIEQLTSEPTLRIAVYALGDSLVHELTIPENPVIVKPEEGAVVTAGESLYVEIGYPGEHQYIAMNIMEQENVTFGAETSSTLLKTTIEGEKLPNVGTFQLTAYSVNASGKVPNPNNININRNFEVFFVIAATVRNIEFTEAE